MTAQNAGVPGVGVWILNGLVPPGPGPLPPPTPIPVGPVWPVPASQTVVFPAGSPGYPNAINVPDGVQWARIDTQGYRFQAFDSYNQQQLIMQDPYSAGWASTPTTSGATPFANNTFFIPAFTSDGLRAFNLVLLDSAGANVTMKVTFFYSLPLWPIRSLAYLAADLGITPGVSTMGGTWTASPILSVGGASALQLMVRGVSSGIDSTFLGIENNDAGLTNLPSPDEPQNPITLIGAGDYALRASRSMVDNGNNFFNQSGSAVAGFTSGAWMYPEQCLPANWISLAAGGSAGALTISDMALILSFA